MGRRNKVLQVKSNSSMLFISFVNDLGIMR